MTEERVKELTEESAVVLECMGLEIQSLERLIRTVAAEARNEGIDELRDAAITREDSWHLIRTWDVVCEAERLRDRWLKEQG